MEGYRLGYVAVRRLELGGGRIVMPGDPVPDGVRDTRTLLSAGWIEKVYFAEDPPEGASSAAAPEGTTLAEEPQQEA